MPIQEALKCSEILKLRYRAREMPQKCVLPRGKKKTMDYFPRKLQHSVCTQPKPVLTDVCARLYLSFYLYRFSFCIFLHFSLSLSLSLPHPLLSSEAWLTWERMSSLRQLSGLASGRVEKRKRENFKGLWAGSQRIVHWAGAGWAQSVSY